jgi:hypothetical protein
VGRRVGGAAPSACRDPGRMGWWATRIAEAVVCALLALGLGALLAVVVGGLLWPVLP